MHYSSIAELFAAVFQGAANTPWASLGRSFYTHLHLLIYNWPNQLWNLPALQKFFSFVMFLNFMHVN